MVEDFIINAYMKRKKKEKKIAVTGKKTGNYKHDNNKNLQSAILSDTYFSVSLKVTILLKY